MFKILHKAIKHRYLLSWLIAFFIGGILYPLTCKAQALPTPTNDTFNTITNGNNSLSFSLFSNVDVLPINSNPVNIYRIIENVANDPLVVGSQLNLMQNNDYTISELTQNEIDSFSSEIPYLYDINGNVVQWDDVYHLHYMNAMFHGDVYIDSSGNILTSDSTRTKTMFQLGIGGALLNVTDIANIYDDIALQLGGLSYSYPLESNINTYSVYINVGYYWNSSTKYAGYIFIPSGFINGNTVYVKETNQLSIYTNDLSNVEYKQYFPPNSTNFIAVNSGTYNINNYNYSYKISFNPLFSTDITTLPLVSYSEFLNNPVRQNYVFDRLNYDNNISVNNSDDIVSFKKLNPLPSTKVIQFNDTYDYDYIKELEQSLNNTDSTPNELFDSTQAIDESNYPINYEIPSSTPDAVSSTLPFPSNNNNPLPNPDPILDYGIVSQPSNQSILDSFSNLQIPFLQNIRYRFPFCIPWDLRDAISLLKFSPTAPAWDFDWEITALGHTYTYHCVGDLSDYDSLALLFRRLMLCAVFIGLAFWTYKLML